MKRTLAPACCAVVGTLVSGFASVGEPRVDTFATAPKVFRASAVTDSADPNQVLPGLRVKT